MAIKQPITENAPDTTPSDIPAPAVQRFVTFLLRWDALTHSQQAYDKELAKLAATGDKLRPQWDALAEERRARLAELRTLTLPLDTVITQVLGLFKARLHSLCEEYTGNKRMASAMHSIPSSIQALGQPLVLNRRIEESQRGD
jgi:hypothetical protein